MRKILFSAGTILFIASGLVAGTGAFFSDSETSSGNTFSAGDIELSLGNSSYYNGILSTSTSWILDSDISSNNGGDDVPRVFQRFNDVKPGDYFESTNGIRVESNDSWLCQDTVVTERDDVTCNEPELGDDPTCSEPNLANNDGDLTNFGVMRWVDDGDNVLETDETVFLTSATFVGGPVGQVLRRSLVDSTTNVFGAIGQPFAGNTTKYIASGICYGVIAAAPRPQDGFGNVISPATDNDGDSIAGEAEDGGFTCDGSAVNNAGQTDSLVYSNAYRAVQSRNNAAFSCTTP